MTRPARAAATDAEQDAASARSAASSAEQDASRSRALASQADREATDAERDAANSRTLAQQADQAATTAEDEARRAEQQQRADTLNGGSDAPGGGGTPLTAEEEQILRNECGQACVDEYNQALTNASMTILDWIKANGVEILLDLVGYTDLKNCFTTGDVESCLWTLVNVGSLLVAVGKLPAVSKAIIKVGSGIAKFFEECATARRVLNRLRQIIERVRALRKGGTITRNALADHEFEQASEIVDELGGHFEGQTVDNTPGIDGTYDGQPASLKTIQPGSSNNIRALANAMTKANSSLQKAGISGAVLFIKAPGITKAEVETSRRAAEILSQGNIVKISVRASDGWVHF